MSIFTDRELEFLASLKTSWQKLYRNELLHLLNEDRADAAADTRLLACHWSRTHLESSDH